MTDNKIEGLQGIYNRVQQLKYRFKDFVTSHMMKNLIQQSNKHKILIVTHKNLMEALTA